MNCHCPSELVSAAVEQNEEDYGDGIVSFATLEARPFQGLNKKGCVRREGEGRGGQKCLGQISEVLGGLFLYKPSIEKRMAD